MMVLVPKKVLEQLKFKADLYDKLAKDAYDNCIDEEREEGLDD